MGLKCSWGAEGISDEQGLVLRSVWLRIWRCCELFGVPQPVCSAGFEILRDLAICSSLRHSSGAGLFLCRSPISRNHMAGRKKKFKKASAFYDFQRITLPAASVLVIADSALHLW